MQRLAGALTVLLALSGCGGSDGGSDGGTTGGHAGGGPGPAGTVTLTHERSGFAIEAPRGFAIDVRKGVYVLEKGDRSLSFSRSITAAGPAEYGAALLEQLGGRVISRNAEGDEFAAEVDRGASRETVVVARDADGLAVTTGRSPVRRPLALDAVREVGASARGGYRLRPPKAKTLRLEPYRSPDGGATALVPAGWDISSSGGGIGGSSDEGAFQLGYSIQPLLPESVPNGDGQGAVVAPYMDAATALTELFPRIAPTVSDIRIRRAVREDVLPGFSSSAMYEFDYSLEGEPWVGVATVATDSPDKYSNFVWGFYYSGIGVPAGADPSVGTGLFEVWRSWDPGGAIAQRSDQAKELMDATNDVWKDTNEFRAVTADRQARDVGCLLQGYYAIEDNSRKYDLPPLPCGQQYVP